MKKNKRFYYNPHNFISVSGMIYRMKQNAIGLSNICILSTMVLITISSTVCLYIGQEDMLQYMYPHNFSVVLRNVTTENNTVTIENQRAQFDKIVKQIEDQSSISIEDRLEYRSVSVKIGRKDNYFFTGDE